MIETITAALKKILFLCVMILFSHNKGVAPPRIDIRIDLEWTVGELLENAPKIRDDHGKNSTLRSFILRNINPHVTYQGKELPCNGAMSAFLTYKYEVPIRIRIDNLDIHAKNLAEIEERLKEWLPIIDSMGFKRKKGNEGYSEKNFPLPETYHSKDGSGIVWESVDGMKIFKLLISVPVDPEHYRKEKKYFLSFAYYDRTDMEVLKKNWLFKLKKGSDGGNTDTSKASF